MNTKLLRKIKKHILEEPKRFIMHSLIKTKERGVGTYYDDAGKKTTFAPCGTAACIAGWATLLSGNKDSKDEDVWQFGAKVLGLDIVQQYLLFYSHNWPDKFEEAFRAAKNRKKRAEIAADRIEHFIKTKGQE